MIAYRTEIYVAILIMIEDMQYLGPAQYLFGRTAKQIAESKQ
jgi:hypothetical protein